jgi:uncharacterized metal-binding protein
MPSGRTHDVVTVMLTAPAFAASYSFSGSLATASAVAGAFVFGGLMFGPDLDTASRQYSRWSFFRVLWVPYRGFFKHRSRFSHGLVFGALIRVVYFLGVISLIALAITLGTAMVSREDSIASIYSAWRSVGNLVRRDFGSEFPLLVFLGLWLGAASHTFTDMAGSFVKTGKVSKFL